MESYSLIKKASSLLVMSIVGGALCSILMGYIADVSSMGLGFIVPLICFVFVAIYGNGWYLPRKKNTPELKNFGVNSI